MDVCSLAEVKGSGTEGGEGGWRDGGGKVVRGCLGNHIAEPVPERYRFTLATIPALLVEAEPQGEVGEREGRRGGLKGEVTYL